MGNLPTLKPREGVALPQHLGFAGVRQRGSHKQYRHADGRGTTVPLHVGRDISPTLLRKIAKDIGLTAEQLLGRPQGRPNKEMQRTRHVQIGASQRISGVVRTWRRA